MRKLTLAVLLIASVAGPLPSSALSVAQAPVQVPERQAARCAELGAPNLDRAGAALDCQRGQYDRGIKTLEELLRRNAITVPPA